MVYKYIYLLSLQLPIFHSVMYVHTVSMTDLLVTVCMYTRKCLLPACVCVGGVGVGDVWGGCVCTCGGVGWCG